jgi:carboxyl-terminal processing protease
LSYRGSLVGYRHEYIGPLIPAKVRPLAALLLLTIFLAACQRPVTATRSSTETAVPAGTQAPSVSSSPTATARNGSLLEQGFQILVGGLVLPVNPDQMAQSAWQGMLDEAKRETSLTAPAAPSFDGSPNGDIVALKTAFATLLSAGKGRLDSVKVERAGLVAMAESLNDCHTAYLTSDQWQSISDDLDGRESIDGLPLTFQLASPYLIESVVKGSSAERAGLKPGDRIASFDGVTLDDVPLSQRKFLSAGAAGSPARLEVVSPNGDRRTLNVQREAVARPVVTSQLMGDVGYIRLRTFTFNLNSIIDPVISSLLDQGARGLIIDLRGNLGGELNADVHLLSRFIPSGLIADSIDRRGRIQESRADGGVLPGPPPLAVLVDGGSLSASELFAEAIEQYQAGEVVGSPTPGCLLGSNFRNLADGSSMQVTSIDVRVGPRQTVVNNIGVLPDAVVPLTAADLAAGKDPQLDRALAGVRSKIGSSQNASR